MDGSPALPIARSRSVVEDQRDRPVAPLHYEVHVDRRSGAHRGTGPGVASMRLSGHEINSQLRQKLEMPTGRHLYVVLGTGARLERYEKVDFREARWPNGQRLGEPVNINHTLLDRIND